MMRRVCRTINQSVNQSINQRSTTQPTSIIMKGYLSSLLPYKLAEDTREVLFEFEAPPFVGEGKLGFVAPELLYWIQLLAVSVHENGRGSSSHCQHLPVSPLLCF